MTIKSAYLISLSPEKKILLGILWNFLRTQVLYRKISVCHVPTTIHTYIIIFLFHTVNFPPVITTVEVFTIGIGAVQQFDILITDANDDDFNLTFSGGVVEAFSILEKETPGQYHFSIQVSGSSQLDSLQPLIFTATDGRGASSERVQTVQVCACINGGECTPDGILGIDSTVILTCLCPDGKKS